MLEADLREAIEDANDIGHFFLIMEHMDKSETEIQNALGVAEVTMRSIRSRIGKKHKA